MEKSVKLLKTKIICKSNKINYLCISFRALFFELKFTVLNKLTASKKVEFALKDQGRNKSWLAKELGLSRPVLYDRLKSNTFNNNELNKLRSIGLI